MPKKRTSKVGPAVASPTSRAHPVTRTDRRTGDDRRQFPPRPEGRRTGAGRRKVDPTDC